MLTYKDIFGTIGFVFIVFGCITGYEGLVIWDTLVKAGLLILAILFLVSRIHIPSNSKGTPLERGAMQRKFRSL
jgi:hypothetical protein